MSAEAAEVVADLPDGQAPPEEPKRPRVHARSARLAAAPAPAPRDQVDPELRSAQRGGDRDLADIIRGLGSQGSYKIKVERVEPEFAVDPATQERVPVAGFLKEYLEAIDEERIKKNHGGGKYKVQFQRQNDRGSYVYAGQITKVISGDPRLDDPALNRTPKPAPSAAPPPAVPASESGAAVSMVKEAFGVLAGQLDRAAHQEPRGPDPMVAMLQQAMADMRASHDREMAAIRAELAEARKKPEDTFKDQLLTKMIDGDSARVLAVKTQYESELSQTRQFAQQNEQRIRDQAQADRAEVKAAHEREIGFIKQGYDAQVASLKLAQETQLQTLKSENERLREQVKDLKEEVKELRGKKDKPLLEQVKDIQSLKEAIGIDEGESTTVDKLLGALPEALPIVGNWFSKEKPKEEEKKPATSRVVQTPDGQKWLQKPDGTLTGPLKKRPAAAAAQATGGEQAQPQTPTIDPEEMKKVVDYLTRACDNNADPATVVQSFRAHVPDWLMQLLRVKTVDEVFFTMAQLPTGSSLSTQKGRVWLRKVREALVGG